MDIFFINRKFAKSLVVAEKNIGDFGTGKSLFGRYAVHDKHSVCPLIKGNIADFQRKMCTGDTERITRTGKKREHAVSDGLNRHDLVFFQKRKQHGNRAALQRTIG